jgi:adenylate cyclase
MAKEIERKFLLRNADWMLVEKRTASDYVQGYIVSDAQKTVRIRIAGEQGKITIKGKTLNDSIARDEYEYTIPKTDAEALLKLCSGPLIEKVRHIVPLGKHVWEIDVFAGENAGLVVAEIELHDENEAFEKPNWIGDEVTHDPRYGNASLVRFPFSKWRIDI